MKYLLFVIFFLFIQNSFSQVYRSKEYTLHFVTQKQTLREIAFVYCKTIYGLNNFVEEIKELNPGIENDEVSAGSEVKIPNEGACINESWVFTFTAAAKGLKAVDHNGRTAQINTRSYFEAHFSHEWAWTDKHLSKVSYSLAREDYIQNDRTLHSPSQFRSRLMVRHEYSPANTTHALEAGFFQETVLRDTHTRDIALSIIPVPYLGTGWERNIMKLKKFVLQSGVGVNWLLPARDSFLKLKNGVEAKGYFEIVTPKGDYQLFYSYARQDSNYYQNSFDLLGMNYSWRF